MTRDERARITRTQLDYAPGIRLELVHMADPFAPVPSGTRGTVHHVDDGGNIHMHWDNGRTLALVPGEDSFRKLTAQELAAEQLEQNQRGTQCQTM